jgi:ABC-type branched-subunit amino acid transport system ATPase component
MLQLLAFTVPGAGPFDLRIGPGEHVVLDVDDPDTLLAGVRGDGPAGGGLIVGETVLTGATPPERWTAGLAVSGGRVPAALDGSVLELVVLGERRRRPPLLGVAAGTGRARAALADGEAAARALAGRVGLARHLDRPLAGISEEVAALADLARALLAGPHALVLRDPEWLAPESRSRIRATALEEGARLRAAVLVLTHSAAPPG